MKIKLFLYNICFICSLAGIQIVSADEHGKQNIGGTIKLFISGGLLSPSFQTIDYEGKEVDNPAVSGSGLVLDINAARSNHAVAIDYYIFRETYSLSGTGSNLVFDTQEEFNALLLGYRYHFNGGFYIGGGILSLNSPTLTATSFNEQGSVEQVLGYESGQPLAITFGYDHIFANGFVIGAHLLRSLPVDLALSSYSASVNGRAVDVSNLDISFPDIKGGVIQSIGLGIGYSW